MIIGFTGTRNGMTKEQRTVVEKFVDDMPVTALHHGACVGSDEQMHRIVIGFKPDVKITVHPGPDPKSSLVAKWCLEEWDTHVLPGKAHLRRNRDIVDAVEVMVATPPTMTNPGRGGTWWTIKEARRLGRAILVVLPDGSLDGPGPATGESKAAE